MVKVNYMNFFYNCMVSVVVCFLFVLNKDIKKSGDYVVKYKI